MIKGDGHGKGLDWVSLLNFVGRLIILEWTLGTLIWEMLTMTTPFAAPDSFDITRKTLKSQVLPIYMPSPIRRNVIRFRF